MKQMPVESFLAWVGKPASWAIRRNVLFQVADREQGGGQLRLPQLMQKITLVLAAVGATQQAPPPTAMRHLRVMASGDALGTQRLCCIQKMLELHFAVAQHVRVGRASGRIFGQEMLEHVAPVFAGKSRK